MSSVDSSDFTTIDTCLDKVVNRFELSVIASKRAEEIDHGSPISIDSERKSTVVALQEISAGVLKVDSMREKIVTGMQKHSHLLVQSDGLDADEPESYDEVGNADLSIDLLDNQYDGDFDLSPSEDEMDLLDVEDMK
jgi:DNA-directed RNA polymerase subunit omega